MSWRDGLVLALRSVLRRPARTALTVAAVALGSGLLVALAAIAAVADTRVVGELGKGGPATAVKVAPAAPDPAQLDSDNLQPGAPRSLDDTAVAAVGRAHDVDSVVAVMSQPVTVVPPPRGTQLGDISGDDPDRGLVPPFGDTEVGVDLGRVRDLPITVIAGRLPDPGAPTEIAVTLGYSDRVRSDAKRPDLLLGREIEIGAGQAVNGSPAQVRARWSRAVIVGVVAQQVADGDLLVPIDTTRAQRAWQLAGANGTAFGLPPPASEYSGAVVVADSLDDIHTVRVEIADLGFASSAPEHLVATVQRYLHVVDIVLGSIGSIALLIAALGIANALLAAVRERRREIGVLKAIGARDVHVLRWFLSEALFCGLAGGLLGSLFGVAAITVTAHVVNDYLAQQGLVGVELGGTPVVTSLIGIVGSAVLALVAAAWPAWRAARLPAREAVGAL